MVVRSGGMGFVVYIIVLSVAWGSYFYGTKSHAQQVPKQAPLSAKLEELEKSAHRVIKTEKEVVYLSIQKKSLAKDTQIVFFKKNGRRLEMIASGRVAAEQLVEGKPTLLVQIKNDEIIKLPEAGDYAVAITDPAANDLGEKKGDTSLLAPAQPKKDSTSFEPGYLEYGAGMMLGHMTSNPSAPVNQFKNPLSYRFIRTHFSYFSGYVPVGLEQDTYWGKFPTSTYYLKLISSDESVGSFKLYYRAPKFFKYIRLMPHLYFLNDHFNTSNVDENLLTTHYSGTGWGVRAATEFVSDLWTSTSTVGVALQKVFFDFTYFPSITAEDQATPGTGVSRGTSSKGSTGTELGVGATVLLYLDLFPYFNRFVVEGGYRLRSYALKFSGTTLQEPLGVPVPENITSTEKERYYYFMFGLRIDDPIKLIVDFANGKISKDKQKNEKK